MYYQNRVMLLFLLCTCTLVSTEIKILGLVCTDIINQLSFYLQSSLWIVVLVAVKPLSVGRGSIFSFIFSSRIFVKKSSSPSQEVQIIIIIHAHLSHQFMNEQSVFIFNRFFIFFVLSIKTLNEAV